MSAIGIGFGGLAVAAGAIYYIMDSVQSSHEKIGVLSANIEKERELRAMEIEKERELRAMEIKKERELRVEGIEKERELRDKDAAIMRAERAVIESELRSVKLQLEDARGK